MQPKKSTAICSGDLEDVVCSKCGVKLKTWNLESHLRKKHGYGSIEVNRLLADYMESKSVFDFILDVSLNRNKAGVAFIRYMVREKSRAAKTTGRFVKEYNYAPKRPAVKALGAYAVACCEALSIDHKGIMRCQKKGVSMAWRYPEKWHVKSWDKPPHEVKEFMNISKKNNSATDSSGHAGKYGVPQDKYRWGFFGSRSMEYDSWRKENK